MIDKNKHKLINSTRTIANYFFEKYKSDYPEGYSFYITKVTEALKLASKLPLEF